MVLQLQPLLLLGGELLLFEALPTTKSALLSSASSVVLPSRLRERPTSFHRRRRLHERVEVVLELALGVLARRRVQSVLQVPLTSRSKAHLDINRRQKKKERTSTPPPQAGLGQVLLLGSVCRNPNIRCSPLQCTLLAATKSHYIGRLNPKDSYLTFCPLWTCLRLFTLEEGGQVILQFHGIHLEGEGNVELQRRKMSLSLLSCGCPQTMPSV